MSLSVYVINLDDSRERLEEVRLAFEGAGLAFERLSAVDFRGRLASDYQNYQAAHTRRLMGRELSGGEVGCYLSHLAAAEKFLQTSSKAALVIEDDMTFGSSLAEALQEILHQLDEGGHDWDVINIGALNPKMTTSLFSIALAGGEDFSVARAHYFPMRTEG